MPVFGLFTVRPAHDADSRAVAALVEAVSSEFGLRWDPEGYDADLKAVASSYSGRGGWFELLERDRELVGTVGMYPHSPTEIELRKMYFRPAVRGLGLGKALLARNLARARSAGFRTVMLETATALHDAIGLYRRFGFTRQQDDPVGCSVGCDQVWCLDLDGYEVPEAMSIPELNEG